MHLAKNLTKCLIIGIGALFLSCGLLDDPEDSDSNGKTNTPVDNGTNSPTDDGNGQTATATPYVWGSELPFKISPSGDVDYFKFTITRAGVYFFTISNIPSSFNNLDFYIYDTELVSYGLGSSQIGLDNTIESFGRQLNPGDYYLKIYSGWYESSNQEMKLSIDFDLTDTLETNGSFNKAYPITLDTYYQATIFPSGDYDFYRFTLDSNQIVRVKIDSISSRLSQMQVYIYDDEGVEKNNNIYRNVSSLDWGFSLKKGTYTLKISDGNNNYSTKPYRLIIASDTTDKTEWNGDISSAANIEFGQPVRAAIYPSYDADYFKFTLPTDDTVKISVDSISAALQHFNIYLFDSELNELEYKSHYYNSITNISFRKFLSAGLYYIKIYNNNSASSFKRFMLTVTKTDTLTM